MHLAFGVYISFSFSFIAGGQDNKTILDQLCGPGMRLTSYHDGKDEEMLKLSEKRLNGRFLLP